MFYVLCYVLHLLYVCLKKKNQNGGWSVLIVNDDNIVKSSWEEPNYGLSLHTSECQAIVGA